MPSRTSTPKSSGTPSIGVVIPSYKVKSHIKEVISGIGKGVSRIYVVDDACPEKTGEYVKSEIKDKRVTVLFHQENQGVGGAVVTGYKAALADGIEVVVKLDGDGQMNPALISTISKPRGRGKC